MERVFPYSSSNRVLANQVAPVKDGTLIPPPNSQAESVNKKLTVLVVDDRASNRRGVMALLEFAPDIE